MKPPLLSSFITNADWLVHINNPNLDNTILRPGLFIDHRSSPPCALRKAGKLASAARGAPGAAPSAGCSKAFEAAYAFADEVVERRWRQVAALSGALCVRGTCTGSQLAALVAQPALEVEPRRAPRDREPPLAARLLDAVAPWPFAFGAVWALLCWPET